MKYKISLFFIIGILLYVIDIGLNSYDEKEIYISDQEIISLVSAWKSQVGRNPTDDEIVRIINNLVEEEINKEIKTFTFSEFKKLMNQ